MSKWIQRLLPCSLALLLVGCEDIKDSLPWFTDLPQALAKAKAENKTVLVDFTGSDWCPSCIMMKKEVFSKPAFGQYATNNLVLVEVDFPRRKALSPEQEKANEALAEKYNPEGLLPTFVLLDKNTNVLGKIEGYLEGGPKAFIAQLEKFKKK